MAKDKEQDVTGVTGDAQATPAAAEVPAGEAVPAETPVAAAEPEPAEPAPAEQAAAAAEPEPAEAPAEPAPANAETPAEPAAKPAKMNLVHIILPIVLMVVALAGILTPILYAHNPGKAGAAGYYVPGQGQGPGGNRQTFGSGGGTPGGLATSKPSGMPSVMPSNMPTVMPSNMPTFQKTGSGPVTCQGSQCPQGGQRGQGQRGPKWPRGNRSMNGLSGGEIAIVAASSVVFLAGAAYLIIALRRRSALRKRERE